MSTNMEVLGFAVHFGSKARRTTSIAFVQVSGVLSEVPHTARFGVLSSEKRWVAVAWKGGPRGGCLAPFIAPSVARVPGIENVLPATRGMRHSMRCRVCSLPISGLHAFQQLQHHLRCLLGDASGLSLSRLRNSILQASYRR